MDRFFGRRRLKKKYELQAQQLVNLGFPNKKLSIKLLELYAGDTDLVLAELHDANAFTAEYHKDEGNKCMKEKRYSRAVELYTKSILLNPRKAVAAVYYSNRAAAYIALKEYDNAIRDGQTATRIDGEYQKAYIRKGTAYFELGMYEKAESEYRRCIQKIRSSETANWAYCIQKIKLCKERQESHGGDAQTHCTHGHGRHSRASVSTSNPDTPTSTAI